MGIGTSFGTGALKSGAPGYLEQARRSFEPQLIALGLGIKQIEKQSLEELEGSLDRVNEAIANPDSFGVFGFTMTSDAGFFAAKAQSESHVKVGILPVLLERKRLVLDRMRQLKAQSTEGRILGIVQDIDDESTRTRIETEISSIQTETEGLEAQAQETEDAQLEHAAQTEEELATLRMDLFERKAEVWGSFLGRESIATMVGALLLVIIAVAQLVAMFTKTVSPDIVNSAFLLILGYFFGQTVSRASSRERE